MDNLFKRIERDIATVVDEVESGNEPYAQLWANLVSMGDFINACKAQIRSGAEDEVTRMNKGEKYYGCEFQIVERKNWEYESLIIDNAKERVKVLQKIAKQAAKINKPLTTEDGELIEPARVKSITTSIRVKRIER